MRRPVLVIGSFLLAAVVGAGGALVWLSWVLDQVDRAEQAAEEAQWT